MEEIIMKHMKLFQTTLYLLLFWVIVIMPGCKDSSTKPEPVEVDNSALLVNSLNIALVQGGNQTVLVEAKDKNEQRETYDITCEDENVATVTSTDSTFTVTAVNYGDTKLIITSNSGKSKEIPIKVYDLQVLDVGELLITYEDTYQFRWNDIGSGGSWDGSFYHPVTSDSFNALGSLGFRGYYNPNGIHGIMVVKAKAGSDALLNPTDYTLVYNDIGSGADNDGSFWAPVPPAGYKAMGIVAQRGYGKPSLTDVVCVREDLTIPGETDASAFIWNDVSTGANMNLGTWRIEPPICGPHENAYLSTGTFVGWNSWNPPSVHSVMNVLNVQLPMLAETPYQQYVPKLTGYDPPPAQTVPILAREMLVPCTIISDPLYANNHMWSVQNSPFYRLERQVYYKLLYHNHNQTSIQQNNSYTKRYGVSATESNEFWNETSISVTAEAGISIKVFEAKVSTTVTTSFGYSSMTSVSELEEDEYESGVDVPAGKAVAIWQRYNRFVLKRHNGTSMEPVKAWEFGINSYVTDDYPDQ